MRYPVPLERFSNEFCAVHLLMHHWSPLFRFGTVSKSNVLGLGVKVSAITGPHPIFQ